MKRMKIIPTYLAVNEAEGREFPPCPGIQLLGGLTLILFVSGIGMPSSDKHSAKLRPL